MRDDFIFVALVCLPSQFFLFFFKFFPHIRPFGYLLLRILPHDKHTAGASLFLSPRAFSLYRLTECTYTFKLIRDGGPCSSSVPSTFYSWNIMEQISLAPRYLHHWQCVAHWESCNDEGESQERVFLCLSRTCMYIT